MKLKRNAHSLPRMGKMTAYTERGSMKGGGGQTLNTKRTHFGIIPTLTAEIKAAYKME